MSNMSEHIAAAKSLANTSYIPHLHIYIHGFKGSCLVITKEFWKTITSQGISIYAGFFWS